ncbi:hypothetical protein [Bremerella cremea]|uniref:hypothetical protein n=1 Tax=Bremerella cremea TaxID=1031537 RepID=UPI0031F05F4B
MRTIVGLLVLLMLPGEMAWGKDAGRQRWAIIATSEIAETGLVELVTAQLSRREAIQLVEREDLSLATRELELSALLSPENVLKRLELGKTLRANAMLLLSMESEDARQIVRAVVCDADLGVRLWQARFIYNGQADIESLAAQCVGSVDEVRQQFPDGVEHIIAIPPFLSEDFGIRFQYLQTRCQDLVTSSLMARPGVALLELDEAHALLREHELTFSEGITRPIATIVQAHFQVTSSNTMEHSIKLNIELTHGEQPGRSLEKTIPLEELDAWLLTEFSEHVLRDVANRPGSLSAAMQKEILSRHAQRFAELGDWQHSVALREAALVLDPKDALLRALAISEYQHRNQPDPDRIWQLSQNFRKLSLSERENEFRHAANDMRVGFQHLAYLIRNRLVGRVDAIGMLGKHAYFDTSAVRAAAHNDPRKVELLQPACAAQREFLRDVYPLIDHLPDERLLPTHLSDPFYGGRYELTNHVAKDVAFNHYDAASLASLRETLLRLLPATDPTTENMLGLFSSTLVPQPGTPEYEPWGRLIADLRRSDRELARLYGHFAYAVEKNRRERSRGELESMLAEVARLDRASEPIQRVINLQLVRPPHQAPRALSAPPPRGNFGPTGRMEFAPISLVVSGKEGETPPLLTGMLRCGAKDVYWSDDRFFVMDEPGILRERKLTDATADHPLYWEVAWDGACIWLHAHGEGILVLRSDGTRLASFNGLLPDYSKGHKIVGLSPRRALMVGSFGNTERAWCGILEVAEDGTPSVDILLEAKTVAEGRSREEASADITTAFRADGLSRVQRKDGKELVVVERHGLTPLYIDLQTLKVAAPDIVAGREGLSTQTDLGFTGKRFLHDGTPLWLLSGMANLPNSKEITFHDGWLYRPGYVWMRQHLATHKLERLQSKPLSQDYWHLRVGSSAHYGLVVYDPFHESQPLSKVTILDEEVVPVKTSP